ncbi:MAG: type II toxin-antitoxin system Phd/YefM family antitoxin [Pseudonocardiaceae bacterium]
MTRTMTATEVKATILALLDEVAAGHEVQIAKHGRIVARLVPATGPTAVRGALAGTARSTATDEDLFGTGEVCGRRREDPAARYARTSVVVGRARAAE